MGANSDFCLSVLLLQVKEKLVALSQLLFNSEVVVPNCDTSLHICCPICLRIYPPAKMSSHLLIYHIAAEYDINRLSRVRERLWKSVSLLITYLLNNHSDILINSATMKSSDDVEKSDVVMTSDVRAATDVASTAVMEITDAMNSSDIAEGTDVMNRSGVEINTDGVKSSDVVRTDVMKSSDVARSPYFMACTDGLISTDVITSTNVMASTDAMNNADVLVGTDFIKSTDDAITGVAIDTGVMSTDDTKNHDFVSPDVGTSADIVESSYVQNSDNQQNSDSMGNGDDQHSTDAQQDPESEQHILDGTDVVQRTTQNKDVGLSCEESHARCDPLLCLFAIFRGRKLESSDEHWDLLQEIVDLDNVFRRLRLNNAAQPRNWLEYFVEANASDLIEFLDIQRFPKTSPMTVLIGNVMCLAAIGFCQTLILKDVRNALRLHTFLSRFWLALPQKHQIKKVNPARGILEVHMAEAKTQTVDGQSSDASNLEDIKEHADSQRQNKKIPSECNVFAGELDVPSHVVCELDGYSYHLAKTDLPSHVIPVPYSFTPTMEMCRSVMKHANIPWKINFKPAEVVQNGKAESAEIVQTETKIKKKQPSREYKYNKEVICVFCGEEVIFIKDHFKCSHLEHAELINDTRVSFSNI